MKNFRSKAGFSRVGTDTIFPSLPLNSVVKRTNDPKVPIEKAWEETRLGACRRCYELRREVIMYRS